MNDQPTDATVENTSAKGAKAGAGAYRVLARKYRPGNFTDLIGQEALVRTLTNAINTGRLAHAFMLTGVRGVGKTTTARIIARAINCVGPDGQGGPTPNPCGVCEPCRAIAEDRLVDVMEMDAASRTGIDDIREIIDGVRYRPTSARFKVYIIDEVHMLSRNAFNALLKTLEEPPEHTKFIFATTEIRKVPVTVLSRCQRFDLRRIGTTVLADYFGLIAGKEGAEVSVGALGLIARAADGSARDGLSLLDQAIAHTGVTVTEEDVRAMLGLADREQIFDLYDAVMRGDMAMALTQLAEQYAVGADPALIIEDMLELTHWLTRIKLVPEAAERSGVPEAERMRGQNISGRLSMGALTRNWQVLLKGLGEVHQAPSALQAAEMVLIRLGYAADLPSPADAVKALQAGEGMAPSVAASAAPKVPSPAPQAAGGDGSAATARVEARSSATAVAVPVREDPVPAAAVPETDALPAPLSFEAVVALADSLREMQLYTNLRHHAHLVHFEPGKIDIRLGAGAPSAFVGDLSSFLNDQTDRRWLVTVSRDGGAPTLSEQANAEAEAVRSAVMMNPLVKSVLDTFPGAIIAEVRSFAATVSDADEAGIDSAGTDDEDSDGSDPGS
jgi:DNA polymerase-3 subunit gamma/tau